MLSEQARDELKKVRRAVNDIHKKLDRTLYEKKMAAKVSYSEVNPSTLVTENLRYIVEKLNQVVDQEQ
tara:strand:+ start:549 stop:752 length:204 start_codon:yes stop_codon:yes gene_type:complete